MLDTKPKLVAVNESFLNKSIVVTLPGYTLIGRKDRDCSDINSHIDNLQSWGGILLFVSSELDGSVIEVLKFDTAERLCSYFIVISARYCCVFGIGLLLEETSARYPLYLTNFRNFAMMSLGLSSWAI